MAEKKAILEETDEMFRISEEYATWFRGCVLQSLEEGYERKDFHWWPLNKKLIQLFEAGVNRKDAVDSLFLTQH